MNYFLCIIINLLSMDHVMYKLHPCYCCKREKAIYLRKKFCNLELYIQYFVICLLSCSIFACSSCNLPCSISFIVSMKCIRLFSILSPKPSLEVLFIFAAFAFNSIFVEQSFFMFLFFVNIFHVHR